MKERSVANKVAWTIAATMLVLAALLTDPAVASSLPGHATLTGYYHRDRQGVGHFGYLYVAPELHDKLAPFQDRLIRLEATRIQQVMNPGPGVVQAVGEIKELPQPPVRFAITTRPSPVVAGRPFQVIVALNDSRQPEPEGNPAALEPKGIMVHFLQPSVTVRPDADLFSWTTPGYTGKQLAVEMLGGQIYSAKVQPFPGPANLIVTGGHLALLPGTSWVWIVSFPADAARTDGQVHVSAKYLLRGEAIRPDRDRTVVPIDGWQNVAVVAPPEAKAPALPADPILRVEAVKLTPPGENGWGKAEFVLRPAAGRKVRLPAMVRGKNRTVDPDSYAIIGRIEARAADGSLIELDAHRLPKAEQPGGAERILVDLPDQGVPIRLRFRKRGQFGPAIARLVAYFVTADGTEALALPGDYHDPDGDFSSLPFGPATGGVQLRIRLAQPNLKQGRPLVFFTQAVNVSGLPVWWWSPTPGYGSGVVVEVDGRPLDLPESKADGLSGWGVTRLCGEPSERTVALPPNIAFAPGRHTLRYVVESKGGQQMNANNEPVPLLDGRLVSNEIIFTIE